MSNSIGRIPEVRPIEPADGDLGFTFHDGKWHVFVCRVSKHEVKCNHVAILWTPPQEPKYVTAVSWHRSYVLTPDGKVLEVEQK